MEPVHDRGRLGQPNQAQPVAEIFLVAKRPEWPEVQVQQASEPLVARGGDDLLQRHELPTRRGRREDREQTQSRVVRRRDDDARAGVRCVVDEPGAVVALRALELYEGVTASGEQRRLAAARMRQDQRADLVVRRRPGRGEQDEGARHMN